MWSKAANSMLIVDLLQGINAPEKTMLGINYNQHTRSEVITLNHPIHGSVLYLPEQDKFWVSTPASLMNLKNMPFGIDPETGKVVEGKFASETTIEEGFTLCNRAPHGIRKFIKEFFG